jgi:VanZ family protein
MEYYAHQTEILSKREPIKYKKFLALALFLGMVGLVFYFSAQPASVSRSQSQVVLNVFHKLGFENFTMRFVRKAAHFTLFATVAVAITLLLNFKFKGLKLFFSSFLISAFIGGLNEFHQMFVPGRGPQVKDVMINASGALLGVIFMITCLYIFRKHLLKRQTNMI